MTADDRFTQIVALMGAAAGGGAFILLLGGNKYNKWAIAFATVVMLIGLGVVSALESELIPSKNP